MSLFDPDMHYDDHGAKEYDRAASLSRRLNQALVDLGLSSLSETALAQPSDDGAFVVLRLPTNRADRLVRGIEDLATVTST